MACSRLSQFQLEIDSGAGKFICKRGLESTTNRVSCPVEKSVRFYSNVPNAIDYDRARLFFLWKKKRKEKSLTLKQDFIGKLYIFKLIFQVRKRIINFNYIWITKYCIQSDDFQNFPFYQNFDMISIERWSIFLLLFIILLEVYSFIFYSFFLKFHFKSCGKVIIWFF